MRKVLFDIDLVSFTRRKYLQARLPDVLTYCPLLVSSNFCDRSNLKVIHISGQVREKWLMNY
jgi:hypothetical protein